MGRFSLGSVVGAVLAVVVSGCWSSGEPGATAGRGEPTPTPRSLTPLVVAFVGEPATFNPILEETRTGRAVGGAVFDTLIRLDPVTAQARPNLATDWEYDPDGHTYTLHLRDDVNWHDGEPFTARDVVFTIDAIHAVPESPYARILNIDDAPVRATAAGAHAVRFRLPRPYAPFIQSLVVPILPAHRFADDLSGDNLGEVVPAWGATSRPEDVIGTGPFRIESYEPRRQVVLRHNPSYWRHDAAGTRLPYLDRYVLRIAEDRDSALRWFLEGALHIFNPNFDEVATLRRASATGAFVVEEIGPDTGSLFLTFNRNPLHYRSGDKTDPRFTWFNDRRFLAAIAHAIDKQTIIDEVLNGMGRPAWSLIPSANPFADTRLVDYAYNIELARQTLQDAGYRDRNGDGTREDSGGARIEFSLATNEDNPVREQIANLVIAQLAEIGMRVSLQTLPFPALFERLDATYDWDAMLVGFTGSVDPASSENLLRSSGELHVWNPLQPKPATAWEAEIDSLLDRGSRDLDPDSRRETYARVQEILHKQLPMIHLVRATLFAARRVEVENFQPSPWGFDQIDEIRLREPAAKGEAGAVDDAASP
jgi:peptide/nickel transport system substrate-binding protein